VAKTISNISIRISASAASLRTDLQAARGAISEFASGIQSRLSGVAGVFGGLKTQIAGALGIGSAVGFVGWGVKLAAEAEQSKVAFEVMLGSATRARDMLAELRSFADRSPLQMGDVRSAAQTLMAFGLQANQVMPSIRMLADVSLGNQEKFKGLALAFGQVAATGRLMGQDLLQMINQGFNPLQVMSEKTGRSMAELKKQMEAGNISFGNVVAAFQAATSEGGRFYQMTERQAGTLAGQWSTLKDSVGGLAKSIGDSLAPVLKQIIDDNGPALKVLGETLVDSLKEMAPSFQRLVPVIQWIGETAVKHFAAFASATADVVEKVSGLMDHVRGSKLAGIGSFLMSPAGAVLGWLTGSTEKTEAALEKAKQKSVETAKTTVSAFKDASFQVGQAGKEIKDSWTAHLEQLEKSAGSVRKQFVSPETKYGNEMFQLKQMFQLGMISRENMRLGAAHYREELARALGVQKEINRESQRPMGGVAAAQAGTTAAFSAIQASAREYAVQTRTMTKQLEAQKLANERLARIVTNTEERIKFDRVSL
jgi:tape measure domain-containing protein